MNIQDFSVTKYVRQYLSPPLRKPRLLALLGSYVQPLQAWRDSRVQVVYPGQEYEARSNARVIVFEKVLNKRFASGTAIYIDETGNHDHTYTFNQVELHPLYLSNASENQPVCLYNHAEYFAEFDFTVNVPQVLYDTSLIQLNAAVDRYKLAGTKYRIRPY